MAGQSQNRPETDAKGNGKPGERGNHAGREFKPGNRANPGGRPKGLARKVREMFGDEGETLLAYAGAVMSGYVVSVHPQTQARSYEKVSVADRTAMLKILLDRGWGKPPEFVPIADDDPLQMGVTGDDLAADFYEYLDEIAARRRRQLEKQDAAVEPDAASD